MPSPRIPDDDARLMRAEYEGPEQPSLERMAERWGWSPIAIRRAILHAGGKMRPAPSVRRLVLPVSDRALLAEQRQGHDYKRLATRYGVEPMVVKHILSRARRAERRA